MIRRLYLTWFALHFFLIIAICARDTCWVLAQSHTILPASLGPFWKTARQLATAALGQRLPSSNILRRVVTAYIHTAGIEGSYGFFAPNVPNSYKLVFEIRYPTGEVEYDLPHVSEAATGVRLATLFDYIARTDYDPLREMLLKMLAYAAWERHPNAISVRTIFGYIKEPDAVEASEGKQETYKVLYTHEFKFQPHPASLPPE